LAVVGTAAGVDVGGGVLVGLGVHVGTGVNVGRRVRVGSNSEPGSVAIGVKTGPANVGTGMSGSSPGPAMTSS